MSIGLYENTLTESRKTIINERSIDFDYRIETTDQTRDLIKHIADISKNNAGAWRELQHELQSPKRPSWISFTEIDSDDFPSLLYGDRVRAARTLRDFAQAGFPRTEMYEAAAAIETLWSALKAPRNRIRWHKLGRYDSDRVYQFICRAAQHVIKLIDKSGVPLARDYERELESLDDQDNSHHKKYSEKSEKYKLIKRNLTRLKRHVSFASSDYLRAVIQSRRLRLIPNCGFQWNPGTEPATDREVFDHISFGGIRSVHSPISKTIKALVCDHIVKHGYYDDAPAISIRASILFDHVFQILEELPPGHINQTELQTDALTAWTTGSVELIREKYVQTLGHVEEIQKFGRDSTSLGKSIFARKDDLSAAKALAAHARRLTQAKADLLRDNEDPLATMQSIKLSLCNMFARTAGELPDTIKDMPPHELILRACDASWWKRRITKTRLQNRENVAREHFAFGKRGDTKFVSLAGVDEVQRADEISLATLKNMYLKNEDGDIFTVYDLMMRSPSAPRNQMVETFKRIRGVSDYCADKGLLPIFMVLTLESEWHRESRGRANSRWNGSTPKESQKALSERWKNVLDRCRKRNIEMIGFRSTEAHGDATPHWNPVCHIHPADLPDFKQIVEDEFYYKHDPEPETSSALRQARMKSVRVRFKIIEQGDDPTAGTAAIRYIAKYIFKHFHDNQDNAQADVPRGEHQIWNAIHGIRRFQFFGLKPHGIYQEMRRIGGGNEEALQRMLDDGAMDAWPEAFQKAHQAASGYSIEDHGFFGKKIVMNTPDDEGSTIDFAEYLRAVEPLDIKLINETFERDTRSEAEKRSAQELANLLHVDIRDFGVGRYGNSTAKRKSHFLISSDGGLEHVVPCQRRHDWIACDEQGNEQTPQLVHDEILDLDYESVLDYANQIPEFTISGLISVLRESPAKLLHSNPRGKTDGDAPDFCLDSWFETLMETVEGGVPDQIPIVETDFSTEPA